MSGPLAADAQRWALELSQLEDPEARQARLAMAPVHWQPTIRHYLAWRLGMAARRATLRKAEPATRVKSLPRGGKLKRVCYVVTRARGTERLVAGNGHGLDSSRPLMGSASGGVLRQCRL